MTVGWFGPHSQKHKEACNLTGLSANVSQNFTLTNMPIPMHIPAHQLQFSWSTSKFYSRGENTSFCGHPLLVDKSKVSCKRVALSSSKHSHLQIPPPPYFLFLVPLFATFQTMVQWEILYPCLRKNTEPVPTRSKVKSIWAHTLFHTRQTWNYNYTTVHMAITLPWLLKPTADVWFLPENLISSSSASVETERIQDVMLPW